MENHNFSWERSLFQWPFSSSLFWRITRWYFFGNQFYHQAHRYAISMGDVYPSQWNNMVGYFTSNRIAISPGPHLMIIDFFSQMDEPLTCLMMGWPHHPPQPQVLKANRARHVLRAASELAWTDSRPEMDRLTIIQAGFMMILPKKMWMETMETFCFDGKMPHFSCLRWLVMLRIGP